MYRANTPHYKRSKLESVMDQAIARTVYKLSETSISRGVQPNIVVEFVAGLDLASPSTEVSSCFLFVQLGCYYLS